MLEKICKICNVKKTIDNFHKKIGCVYNVRNECKNCRKIETSQYYDKNKEKIAAYGIQYNTENKEKISEYNKNYQDENKEVISVNKKEYYKENIEKLKIENRKQYHKIKKTQEYKKRRKNWENKNKTHLQEYQKKYRTENWVKLYTKLLYRINNIPQVKLSKLLRSRVRIAIKNASQRKTSKSFDLIGCTGKYVFEYITDLLKENMTWINYGKYWEIDHIIPISWFDLSIKEEQYAAFNYKNLSPETKEYNLKKRDRIEVITSECVFFINKYGEIFPT